MKIETTGVVGLLGILFVGLKLTHYIDWCGGGSRCHFGVESQWLSA